MSTFAISTGSLVVRTDTVANDTLSGLAARQGVTPVDGDLVLVTAQSDATQNGPYVARAAAWDRVISVQTGQSFFVSSGTDAGKSFLLTTAGISPASFNSTTGACGTALSFAGGSATYNAASPGPIGGTTPSTGAFQNLTLTGNQPTPVATQPSLFRALYGDGSARIGIQNDVGSKVLLGTSATTVTAGCGVDFLPFTLAANATRDYTPGNGGFMIVSVPANASAPMALLGVTGNGSVTLNGATLAGGISLTLDNANTLNVYQIAGNQVRFQNKTGITIQVMVMFIGFGAG